jgi:hypothetical protein
MKIGDLVRIKLPSARGLYIIVGRGDNKELEEFSQDRCWKLYGFFYEDLGILEMLEKWLEVVSEAQED